MNILVVLGTRPEAVKMAPVIRALRVHPGRPSVSLCLTAQHRDLLDQALVLFELPVDYDLNLMRPDQSLTGLTSGVLAGLEPILRSERPDLVLVHGDTTTSFAAALAAFYHQIPVGHVEAGLRSHHSGQPFPEELNRRMTDALATHHFAPTEGARENLIRENIDPSSILVTGNTVVDALLFAAGRPCPASVPRLEALGRERELILVTAHRRESFGAPFFEICRALRTLAGKHPGVEIACPVHPNPRVSDAARKLLGGHDRIHLLEPLEYLPFIHLMKRARLILTDSGGIQEEAPSFGVPVLVLRDVTERPEAVAAGTARLVGTHHDTIVAAADELLSDCPARSRMLQAGNPFGDGQAGQRIADYLMQLERRSP
jgi:UDP-N-acetylglucosamine 2-epimerase (hydrolysing)